jgi:hypothetical protein
MPGRPSFRFLSLRPYSLRQSDPPSRRAYLIAVDILPFTFFHHLIFIRSDLRGRRTRYVGITGTRGKV